LVTVSYPFTETGRGSKLLSSSPVPKKFTVASCFFSPIFSSLKIMPPYIISAVDETPLHTFWEILSRTATALAATPNKFIPDYSN